MRINTHIKTLLQAHTHIYVHIGIYKAYSRLLFLCASRLATVYWWICIHWNTRIYVYVYLCICVVYIETHVFMYMCIYPCTYIYTCMFSTVIAPHRTVTHLDMSCPEYTHTHEWLNMCDSWCICCVTKYLYVSRTTYIDTIHIGCILTHVNESICVTLNAFAMSQSIYMCHELHIHRYHTHRLIHIVLNM